jgi:hypothetical protein
MRWEGSGIPHRLRAERIRKDAIVNRTNQKNQDPDFALADAAKWPEQDHCCLVCSRSGPGPYGRPIICERCESQLIAIFGRDADGELRQRAYDWVFDGGFGGGHDESDREGAS